MYKLTVEGETYLKEGLPEKKLLEKLRGGPMPLEVLRSVKGFQIGLSWAKKNGWIRQVPAGFEITELGRKAIDIRTAIEEGLHEISQNRKPSDPVVEVLLSRQLVEEMKEKKAEFNEKEISFLTTEAIVSKAWERIPFKKYDVKTPVPHLHPGKKQVYRAFLDEVKRELIGMGFKEMRGPLVELSFFNMDALYMPQDHPARGVHDIFFTEKPKYGSLRGNEKFFTNVAAAHRNGGKTGSKGWGVPLSERESTRLVLRSQGTALSARTLMNNPKIPGSYFSIARVYRPEKLDATHLMEFNQLEGIVLREDANFRQILGLLKDFAIKIAGTDKVRFRPAYFPFTEPSVQGMVFHEQLEKWIESVGEGMFRPELTRPLGINVPVMAWGIGIDRLFMIREGLSDIRELFSHDLKFLRSSKVV